MAQGKGKSTRARAATPATPAVPATPAEPPKRDRWLIHRDGRGEYRWTHKAGNNKVVGASTEGYKRMADCIDNMKANGYVAAEVEHIEYTEV